MAPLGLHLSAFRLLGFLGFCFCANLSSLNREHGFGFFGGFFFGGGGGVPDP